MSKFCTKCGAPLDQNSKFCTRCGTKIENMLGAQFDSEKSNCNQPANYADEIQQTNQSKKPLKPWQIALIAGGGVVLALIIVVIVAASSCGTSNKSVGVATTKSSAATTKATQATTEVETTTEAETTTTTATPTTAAIDYSQFVGSYQAYTGGAHCPCMDITNCGSYISINIIWGAGMDGYSEWNMTAKKDGNRLVYYDCNHTNVLYDSVGNKSYETKYTNGSGYFEIQGEHLLWHDDHGDTVYEFMQY